MMIFNIQFFFQQIYRLLMRSSCLVASLIFLFLFSIGKGKLIYTAISIRHGARYPLSSYDIYDSSQTRKFSGQLTTVGMRQLYLLGSYIKSQYIDRQKLINSTLFTKQVQIFASSSERCAQSALCFGLGLFPFGTGHRLPENISQRFLNPPFETLSQEYLRSHQLNSQFALKLGLQPIPSKTNNHFFRCSRQQQITNDRLNELRVQLMQFQASQYQFIQRLKIIFNLKPEYTNIIGLTNVYDVVICDMYLGRKLPTQFTTQDFKQLEFIQAYLFPLVYAGNLGKVFATPILQLILDNMKNIIKKGKDEVKKFTILSGHDTNLVPLFTFLNLTSPQCQKKKYRNESISGNCAEVIPFASNLIFQLHENDQKAGKFFVKVRYNGDYYKLCEKQALQCDSDEFFARVMRDMIDFNKECPNTTNILSDTHNLLIQ